MNKADLKDVLALVKEKLARDTEAACGLFWPDAEMTTRYAVGEEDCMTDYAVGECDDDPTEDPDEPVTTRYAVRE